MRRALCQAKAEERRLVSAFAGTELLQVEDDDAGICGLRNDRPAGTSDI
jgi:hypothetical protein